MADYTNPKYGVAYVFYGCLVSQADTKLFKSAPTLAAGDFKVSIDGGAFANLATLPTNTPGTFAVKFSLSAGEMSGSNILVVAADASGAEWCDQSWCIQTSARGLEDLAYPATSGRSMVVDASGLVDANAVKVGPTGSGTTQTARDIGASVLISPGNGLGQLDVTSGVVKSNVFQVADISAATQGGSGNVIFIRDAAWSTYDGSDTAGTGTLLTRLTALRAGYLDNLNIGGNVASSAEATAIQNNTRVVRVVPEAIELPATTREYRVEVLLYDDAGNMEAPDSAPTIALVNQAGTDRSSRLDSTTMTLVSTGRYRAIYTSTAGDTKEQLVWAFSVVEGGNTRIYGNTSYITDSAATDFTSADRTKLEAIHTKLPSATYLVGTANSDGSLTNLDAAITSRLAPTTPGRTLDVSAAGNAGIDWSNIEGPTTTVNLAGTTITAVENPVDIGSLNGNTNASLYLEALVTEYDADEKLNVHVISVANDAITGDALAASAGTELAAAVLAAATSTPIHADLRTWIGTAPLALVSQRVQADANVTLDQTDLDAIADALIDALAGVEITYSGPVLEDGTVELVEGDDYTSRPFTWTITGYTGPSLNNAAAVLRFLPMAEYNLSGSEADAEVSVSLTLTQASTTVTVSVAPTAAQLADLTKTHPPLPSPNYKIQVRATSANVTLVLADATRLRLIGAVSS